jgi:ferredoxin
MKARVDPVVCEGFGPCHDLLPEVFHLDEWGYAFTEGDGQVPPDKEQEACQAAQNCPVHAIRLEE